ncbi:coiled-coil domain-containing protein 180-like isoform X3 [Convolutriloba macropyga]|uniref:coiled-coil domain-containing protein 180-like isoform X3 n=1 Tax=Convolutriloba macropyga TaxID=536237 RepID=UPI003F527452
MTADLSSNQISVAPSGQTAMMTTAIGSSSTGGVGSMKPIANGQMYRQIFEAEVQLVNSLATSKATRRQRREQQMQQQQSEGGARRLHMEGDKPVVSNAPVASTGGGGGGLLNERQKTWATSLPNDWKTENPVLRRYKSVAQQKRVKESSKYLDEDEVACLPDTVVPVSLDPDSAGRARTLVLVDKLTQGRRERHRAAYEDMEQEVSLLGKKLDEEMAKRCQETSDFLERQQDEIDRIMQSVEDTQVLQSFDNAGLLKVWEAVLDICQYRQEAIRKLNTDLREIETRRRTLTFDVLRSYFLVFERIAHLLPQDVKKMMETETQSLNEVLMENEVRLSQFQGMMHKHEFQLERSLRDVWEERRHFWRTTKQNVLLGRFKQYMASPEVTKPAGAMEILERFYSEQEMLNNARKELMTSFNESFVPPKSHKPSVYQWNSAMGQFSKQLLAIQEKYMTLLHTEYERVCQNCLGELEEHKKSLIDAEVCDEKSVTQVMETHFLPLVGTQQRLFERTLQVMDTSLEEQNKEQFEEVKSLFKFCQGLAHVWDQHEAGLAHQERQMQENLNANRNRNDAINQEREASLDMAIDKLRQETSESGLRSTLRQVMDILDRISTGYEEFALQQQKIVNKYPTGVHQEFDKYDANLLKFFGISRKHPNEKKKPTAGAATTDGGATGSGPNTARVPPVPKQATSKDQQGSSTDRGTQQQDTAKDSSRSVKTPSLGEVPQQDTPGTPTTATNTVTANKPPESPVLSTPPSSAYSTNMTKTVVVTGNMKALGDKGAATSGESKEQKMRRTVKEIIQMSSGVQFYVLSVAGADGVIDTLTSKDQQDQHETTAVKGKGGKPVNKLLADTGDGIELTEDDISLSTAERGDPNSLLPQPPQSTLEEGNADEGNEDENDGGEAEIDKRTHLNTCELPRNYFQRVKRELRHNFLEQLERWRKESDQRAQSIVSAKTGELKNELQLKKHLHQPRAKRAEVDIHNVRAAELVMHSERVERHIKGVNETLKELRNEFVSMSGKHDTLHEEFKQAVQALETVFQGATKCQKLQEIQAQLKKEKGSYMDRIRSDLRAFRQKMDDTSQMLREANSRFIKGFKVFSEGGNFCVEEIEQYKTVLDRVSGQIEQTEGVIMADLENMESSRMDRANSVCNSFENKFKHHMADLTFVERLSRWLTNTQVKIKTEASESNTQSQTLSLLLNKIDRKIDAIQHPSPDKESITAIDLQEWLVTVFDTFNARAEYLNCLKVPVTSQAAAGANQGGGGGNPGPDAEMSLKRDKSRLQIASVATVLNAVTPGKVGFFDSGARRSQEESAMRLIKNIFHAQKTKLSLHQEASQNDLQNPGGGGTGRPGEGGTGGGGGAEDKSRATFSRRSTNMSEHSAATASKQRVSSGGQTLMGTRRGSKGIRFDKKYLVFGDRTPDGTHFLANIQRILQYTLEGMLVVSDSYYRNKGLRAITRPQAIQDTFDSCAEVIGNKLQNYHSQAEDFYNNTLQEFRLQIRQLESKVSVVPELVMRQFFQERISTLRDTRPIPELLQKSEQLAKKRSELEARLHPDMGHPNRVKQLGELDGMEQERHKEILDTIHICNSGVNELLNRQAKSFCSDLAKLAEQLLLQYDNLLLIEDVNMGNFGMKELETEELIRRKAKGESLEEPVEQPVVSRGRGNWEGIPLNTLSTASVMSQSPSTLTTTAAVAAGTQLEVSSANAGFTIGGDVGLPVQVVRSPVVSTLKNSDVHKTVDTSKDKYYELFVAEFKSKVRKSEETFNHERIQERRWSENWQKSVAKITALY